MAALRAVACTISADLLCHQSDTGDSSRQFLIRQEILNSQDSQPLELFDYQAIPNGIIVALTPALMTLKIERFSGKRGSRIRLHGELRSEHLDEVRAEIERGHQRVTLDLGEVDLVDIDAVRFLNACEAQGVEVVNCSRYIREWMSQERGRDKNSKGEES